MTLCVTSDAELEKCIKMMVRCLDFYRKRNFGEKSKKCYLVRFFFCLFFCVDCSKIPVTEAGNGLL